MYKYLLIDFGNYTVDIFNTLDVLCDTIKTNFPPEVLINHPESLKIIRINSDGYGIDVKELKINNVELTTNFTLDLVEE